jgi:pimeloyl-ACP methyl ester carboxylesterase
MDRVLALSGWGQPHDALLALVPGAVHGEYAHHTSVRDALRSIVDMGQGCNTAIGWSLGGQLLVRAIAAGMLRPQLLVLIAAPFQFVESSELRIGMKRDKFEKFRDNYKNNPARTLDKAHELIIKGDSHEMQIRAHLARQDKSKALAQHWLEWLHLMDGFSCADLHLADFPPTLLVHGEDDVVVTPDQSQQFAHAIPHAKLSLWPHTGHAPHWHDTALLQALIKEYAHV